MPRALCRRALATGWLVIAASMGALVPVATAWGQPVETEAGDARIIAAREYASRGDTARLEQMASTPGSHPLEPYVGYWLLATRVARISDPLATQPIRDYLQANEGSLLAERLRIDWLKRLGRENQWQLFNEEYSRVQQPDGELLCDAVRGRGASADIALQTVEAQWLTLTDASDACAASLQALVDAGRKSADDVQWRFRRMVEANRPAAARQAVGMMSNVIAPDPATLGRAFDNPMQYLMSPAARGASTRGARELVLAAVARAARTDPRATYLRWRALNETHYSVGERAYAIGQIAWGAALAQMPEAVQWFAAARDLLPNMPMSDEQAAWQMRSALRAGDWPAVQAATDSMTSAQRNLPEWTYWQGRALQLQGHPLEARALFERYAGEPTFYGILSAEALGRSISWPQAAIPPTLLEMSRVESSGDVRRAIALLRLDMRVEALREWSWGMRGAEDRFLLSAAEYARRIGLYDRAINAADRTRLQHDYSLRYLAPYYDVFSREARTNRLDLHWVYGLTRQESRFHPVARSSAGAQGLMQIMPATGRMMARLVGIQGYNTNQLAETEPNIQLGTAYLRNVLDSLNNSYVMATAAYNAGPGRAKRWRDNRALEGAIYAETIPITETRDYVKKVMANAIAYAMLLDGRPISLTQLLGTVPGDTMQAAR
ncbi:MAG: transglycosylase [Rhodocyclales bacterium]|nr:transglycosylase [Rhodocyclales bacterium]